MVGIASAGTLLGLHSLEGAEAGVYKALINDNTTVFGTVPIASGGNEIWTANESALCDVSFPAKAWTGVIYRNTNVGSHTYKTHIGYYDDTDNSYYSAKKSDIVTIGDGLFCKNFTISDAAFTVPENKWLALKVVNEEATKPLTVVTTGGSYVIYPEEVPAYPTPELSTLVLFSVGLLALGGYVVLRKRKLE